MRGARHCGRGNRFAIILRRRYLGEGKVSDRGLNPIRKKKPREKKN